MIATCEHSARQRDLVEVYPEISGHLSSNTDGHVNQLLIYAGATSPQAPRFLYPAEAD